MFRDVKVDVAVLEVGLGGRLDATNVVEATAAVITSVDFDHEQYLGHTLEAIAREKAGVIKPGAIVVLAPNPPVVEGVVAAACEDTGASLIRARDDVTADVLMVDGRAHLTLTTPVRSYGTLTLSLPGRHQAENAMTAIRLLEALASSGRFEVPAAAVRAAVEDAEWAARLETITISSVSVLLDGAHNPAGARALADHVLETYRRHVPMVIGAMARQSPRRTRVGPRAGRVAFHFHGGLNASCGGADRTSGRGRAYRTEYPGVHRTTAHACGDDGRGIWIAGCRCGFLVSCR